MTVPSSEHPYAVGPNGPLYLTTGEVAERFRVSDSTVRYWRQKGEGPLGVSFGSRVLYPLPGIEAWEAEKLREAQELQAQKSGQREVRSLRANEPRRRRPV